MNQKYLEAAKSIKTEKDLCDFSRMLKKVTGKGVVPHCCPT